jgi:hypothetical protein
MAAWKLGPALATGNFASVVWGWMFITESICLLYTGELL